MIYRKLGAPTNKRQAMPAREPERMLTEIALRVYRPIGLVLSAFVASASLVLILAAKAPAASYNDCGDIAKSGAGIYNVTSGGVSCPAARGFAKGSYRHCDINRCSYAGFTCPTRQLGEELFDRRCTSGSRVVRYQFGS